MATSSSMRSFFSALGRRKVIRRNTLSGGLARVLTTFHLTMLSIGTTLGLGVYVLPGKIAATKSGPAIVISLTIAAFASLLSSLCYAEFAARVSRAGSVYVYAYVTVGEFVAFIVGWDLILEYMIGTASVARGYSEYIDSLCGQAISRKLQELAPMHVNHLSPYPDFVAALIIFLLAILIIVGVKESTRFNSLFTMLNLLIIIVVVVCGIINSDIHNWQLSSKISGRNDTNDTLGNYSHQASGSFVEGFFPFGFTGVMQGAATSFYCYLGFDIIATSAEEAINPGRTVPRSIGLSLVLIFIVYLALSTVMTLMWPYYELNTQAPIAYIFDKLGWSTARWVTSIGAIFGLSTSLLGAIFPLPRVIYSMAQDGLIFPFLGSVSPRFRTPVNATVVSCTIAIVLTVIFDVNQLADMMSIGTLVAYSLGAICVVILRYRTDDQDDVPTPVDFPGDWPEGHNKNFWALLFNSNKYTIPNEWTSHVSAILSMVICAFIIVMDVCFVLGASDDSHQQSYFIAAFTSLALVVVNLVLLSRQPQSLTQLPFKAPFLPWLPMIAVAINVYLILNLSPETWIRFIAWMAIGFVIYFGYGIRNSTGFILKD